MQEINPLVALDDLDPLERLDTLLVNLSLQDRRVTEQALLVLFVIDTLLEVELGAKSTYVLDDGVLLSWLSNAVEEDVRQTSYTLSLIFLDEADLIFRFTCAKKFAIADKRLKQLRINSWGKAYVNDRDLPARYPSVMLRLKEICEPSLKLHANEYTKLTALLRQPIMPSVVDDIKILNESLPLKLLS